MKSSTRVVPRLLKLVAATTAALSNRPARADAARRLRCRAISATGWAPAARSVGTSSPSSKLTTSPTLLSETGSIPSDETLELPKRLVAFAAQAHGAAMIGVLGTVADYSDPAAYKRSAERACRFGFVGATCVHPGLVQALNEAFTPDPQAVANAHRIIDADASAAAQGRGSFTLDGKMIDIPVVDRARRLIARHDAIERRLRR